MKREELRNRYIREICDKHNNALRRLAETNSDDISYNETLINENDREQEIREMDLYLSNLANDIEREVDAMLNENKVTIGFKRLTDEAILPTKAHPTDSGYDLYAAEDVIIEPGETAIVPTGIAVELPPSYEAQIRPRSGITAKTKLRVQLGTIDNDYRGELGIIADNVNPLSQEMSEWHHTVEGNMAENRCREECTCGYFNRVRYVKGTYLIRKGDRIAQLVIQRLPETVAVEIDEFSEDSERGAGGFGSTGV